MRFNLLLVIILFAQTLSAKQNIPKKTVEEKVFGDTVNVQVDLLNKENNLNDSLYVSINQLESLVDTLKKNKNNFGDYLPSIIAILVVLISTGGAIYIGKKQLKSQIESATKNLRSQESQNHDQLNVAREQIKETSLMSIAQVRANNISQARINWIQDLRDNISQFIGLIIPINYKLKLILRDVVSNKKDSAQKQYTELLPEISKAKSFQYKIRLQLSKDQSHQCLEKLFIEYEDLVLKNIPSMDLSAKLDELEYSILEGAKLVLKEAWEQAKNEGKN